MQSVLHPVVGPSEAKPPQDLSGRVALVTGGPTGIGFEISRSLAYAGCRVITVNKTKAEGDEAISLIKREVPDAAVEWLGCDVSQLSEVKRVFLETKKTLPRLDFLVLSAGKNVNQYDEIDGIDSHFMTNFLGNYYVTNLLWSVLRETSKQAHDPAPRVVFESSEMHRFAPKETQFKSLEELNNPNLNPIQYYARTKLAQILFAKYCLAGKVIKDNGDKIYATSVHPGAVQTKLQQQWKEAFPGLTGRLLYHATMAVCRDPEQGAYSGIWALTSPDIETKNMNGWYFTDPDQPGKETEQASSEENAMSLWRLSDQLIKSKLGDDALSDWNHS